MNVSANPDTDFWLWLETMRDVYRSHGSLDHLANKLNMVETEWGEFGLDYDEDECGEFVRLGYVLPDGVYAEIEDGTYGQQQAFRIYYDGEWD